MMLMPRPIDTTLSQVHKQSTLGDTSAIPMQCNELVQWVGYAKMEGGSSGSKFVIPLDLMITDLRPEMVGVVSIR